jgi:glycosyltransferase involved in cell wall biosynthesis
VTPRVLVISEIPTPYRLPLFRALAESGLVELEVLFCAEEQPDRPWELTDELRGFRHEIMRGFRIPIRTRRNTFVYEVNPRVLGRLARRDFDAVVVGGYAVFAEQAAIVFAQAAGVPYLIHAESHHGKPRGPITRWAKAAILPPIVGRAGAGLAAGSAAARYLASYGLHPGRIRIVPNTIDVAAYAAGAAAAREQAASIREKLGLPDKYVFFAGRLFEAKGVGDLIAAIRLLGDESPPVVVAGVGPLSTDLEAVPQVKLLGFQPQPRLIELLALASATLVPSRVEPWGVAVNEALACGCPVVVTDAVGAAEDLVQDGRDGRIVPTGDISALAAAMVEELPRPDPAAGRIGRWTYEFGVEQFAEAVQLAVR